MSVDASHVDVLTKQEEEQNRIHNRNVSIILTRSPFLLLLFQFSCSFYYHLLVYIYISSYIFFIFLLGF